MKRVYLNQAKKNIARPNTIRSINRQIVLNFVRDRSPISRADIARETALNRSTVSTIADSLIDANLIEEIGAGSSTGGRKPTLLRLKAEKALALGIDITPTNTTIAIADLGGKVLDRDDFPTDPDAFFMSEQIIQRVSKIHNTVKDAELEIGISVPGIADNLTGKILFVPYFQWRDWDICSRLQKKTGLYVTVENDANAIALAELWFGNKQIRSFQNFITVMVSEGIGTGIIFDGQLYRGEKGAAGEFGHMIVGEQSNVLCSCGRRDCWEAWASVTATLARFSDLSKDQPGVRKDPDINELIRMALNDDQLALQTIRETGRLLGIGISNLIVGLSPQAIVISGAIVDAWEIISKELKPLFESSVRHGLESPELIRSTLGTQPTLIGSLNLVLARKFASA
jgi:predicted NBD/HSP70 family sugar kinase